MEAEEFKALFEKQSTYENIPVPDGEMPPRERFMNTMEFQKVDRIIDMEFGYWKGTLRRWHQEGLPEYVNNDSKADVYFGFDVWRKTIPSNVDIQPGFEREVLEDDGEHQIIYDHNHIKCEVFKDGKDTIPHYLEFPIKDRESYQPFKERLHTDLNKRILTDLKDVAEKTKDRNYILQSHAGSTAGKVRNWMGFEGICMALYDQPELLDEILEDIGNVSAAVAEEITKHVSVDLVSWWEDIAFKNGPVVTPDFFINKCGPIMKRVMDIYAKAGAKYGYVDCDGDFKTLMPGWLNNGVNIMFPLEVASGIHPEILRKDHPGIRMMGGVDKVVLTRDKSEIRKELQCLKALADEGGFIPHVDHRVQADVPYDNYLYYLEVKRDLFEIPNKIAE